MTQSKLYVPVETLNYFVYHRRTGQTIRILAENVNLKRHIATRLDMNIMSVFLLCHNDWVIVIDRLAWPQIKTHMQTYTYWAIEQNNKSL